VVHSWPLTRESPTGVAGRALHSQADFFVAIFLCVFSPGSGTHGPCATASIHHAKAIRTRCTIHVRRKHSPYPAWKSSGKRGGATPAAQLPPTPFQTRNPFDSGRTGTTAPKTDLQIPTPRRREFSQKAAAPEQIKSYSSYPRDTSRSRESTTRHSSQGGELGERIAILSRTRVSCAPAEAGVRASWTGSRPPRQYCAPGDGRRNWIVTDGSNPEDRVKT
jgi:hypothetical protein